MARGRHIALRCAGGSVLNQISFLAWLVRIYDLGESFVDIRRPWPGSNQPTSDTSLSMIFVNILSKCNLCKHDKIYQNNIKIVLLLYVAVKCSARCHAQVWTCRCEPRHIWRCAWGLMECKAPGSLEHGGSLRAFSVHLNMGFRITWTLDTWTPLTPLGFDT